MNLRYEPIAATAAPEACWELYHENSKNGRRMRPPLAGPTMPAAPTDLTAPPAFPLGPPAPLDAPLAAVLAAKPLAVAGGRLPLAAVSALLAGIARKDGPLEVRFHASAVDGLAAGLYRHDPASGAAVLLRRGDLGARIAGALIEPATTAHSAIKIFLVGLFDRAAAGRGERGYRDALMAAGASGRDLVLAGAALRLGCVEPDFYDRELDAVLGLDGLTAGTLAVFALGAGMTGG